MKKIKQITALCLILAVSFTALSVPSFATDYQSKYNFWNWAYDHTWFLGKLITGSADNVCSVSEDSLHHASQHSADGLVDGEYTYSCICDHCGQTFKAVATDLEATYENETPDYTVDSDGNILNVGKWEFRPDYAVAYADFEWYSETFAKVTFHQVGSFPASGSLVYRMDLPKNTDVYIAGPCYKQEQIDGEIVGMVTSDFVRIDDTHRIDYETITLDGGSTVKYFNSGEHTKLYLETTRFSALGTYTWYCTLPIVRYYGGDVDLTDTPIGGGGSISYVDDNSNNEIIENQFFDQSTNTYHNPITNESQVIEDWEYDYSTRTYTGHTENGDVLITYGDENISVVEGGNTYNYYYATPDSSGGNGGSGGSGDTDGESIWDKLGHLLGELVGGLLDLITGVISGLLDNLIALVETTLEKLGSIVNLFGSFGDALKSLWSWLPEDIVTILAAGVSVVVFASVIKLFI